MLGRIQLIWVYYNDVYIDLRERGHGRQGYTLKILQICTVLNPHIVKHQVHP